jgi:hypothetical protein
MSTRFLVGILIFLSILFVAALAGLFLFKKIEERAQIHFGQEVVTEVLKDIKQLKGIGFSEQDEAVRALRARAKRSQHKVNELQKNWHIFKRNRTLETTDANKLARMIQLDKKMMRSHTQDINEYQKLGLPQNNKAVDFAKDSIVNLALALADLKKQQAAIQKGKLFSAEQADRIRCMIQLNKQAMNYYKTELKNYAKRNAMQEPKAQFAKKQLTQKARAMNALEELMK